MGRGEHAAEGNGARAREAPVQGWAREQTPDPGGPGPRPPRPHPARGPRQRRRHLTSASSLIDPAAAAAALRGAGLLHPPRRWLQISSPWKPK